MGQALYRKYRSRSLDEVVGQEHITTTLRRAIKSGKISHAYLLTGPRGVGKTSIARILAHELNEVAYDGEDAHLDIIEIDAASNGGVDEIRDLRDKVYVAPTSGKYKVYIIDEVHMMTTAAFNALLKTLEEPPAHAIFILATTEAHKVPATIVSRSQRFTFKPIAVDKMLAHLRHIADSEQIKIDDDALALIAAHSEGSFRDAISMLDQASGGGKTIGQHDVEALLGIPSGAQLEALIGALQAHDPGTIVRILDELRSEGYQAAAIAKQLAGRLRADLLTAAPQLLPPSETLAVLQRLTEVPASHNAEQTLELSLLEVVINNAGSATRAATPTPQAFSETTSPQNSPAPPRPVAKPEPPMPEVVASQTVIDMTIWQALLDTLKKQHNTLYGVIRMAHAAFAPGHITLTFGFVFHQKRANDPKNKKVITSTLEEITRERFVVECKYDKTATPLTPASKVPTAPALGAVTAVFGGGEILQ